MTKHLVPGDRVRVNKRDFNYTGQIGVVIRQESSGKKLSSNTIYSVRLDSGRTTMLFRYKLNYLVENYNE